MRKNKFLLLFVLFSVLNLQAEEYKFSCYNKIQYGYINGIKNINLKAAQRGSTKFEKVFKLDNVNTIYNETWMGGAKDLYDSFFQKVEEAAFLGSGRAKLWLLTHPWGDDHREDIFSQIRFINKVGEKLVLFSHSQGNLYANLACQKLGREAFENIQIATPSSYIGCGEPTHYTSSKSDSIFLY